MRRDANLSLPNDGKKFFPNFYIKIEVISINRAPPVLVGNADANRGRKTQAVTISHGTLFSHECLAWLNIF